MEDPSALVQTMMYEQVMFELKKEPKNENLIKWRKKLRWYICRYYNSRQEKRYTKGDNQSLTALHSL